MGLGNVMQANGSMIRAASEFNLLKMEESKRVRAGSYITGARMQMLDGVAREAYDTNRKSLDAFFQERSAKDARNAAIAGFVSAIAGAGSSITSAASGTGGATAVVGAVLKGAFSAIGAFMAIMGAQDEYNMAKEQNQKLSADAKADQDRVKALDGNPSA